MSKSFLIDTTRCTACRGCQLACKEWNELPANATKQRGSHQNPPDLNFNNYKLVRFAEALVDGKAVWNFFPDQCRHCVEPPCKAVADSYDPNAIYHDKATGAVVFTEATKALKGVNDPNELCPYNIPRKNEKTGTWSKCTMCFERITRGMLPACVKVCPTGTMNFGEREAMIKLGQDRLAELKKAYPKAMLADMNDVNVIFLLAYEPAMYHKHAVADAGPVRMDRKSLLAHLARPLRILGDLNA